MSSAANDPALETLLLPLADGLLAWPAPGGSLFLRARTGVALQSARRHAPVCEQGFKPWADALARDGFDVSAQAAGSFPLVLVLAPRQRDESRALLVRALDQVAPGGVVLACAANQEGGRSLQDDLAWLAGPVQVLSKHHCRASWTAPLHAPPDPARLEAWRGLDAPRPILDGRFRSRPGLFAWDRIDPGSALLAAHLPPDLAGRAADFGAGWGYLSGELLARCPGIVALDLYEAEARALELARANLAGARLVPGFHWHDVAAGVTGTYDVVVSNPPFHQGRADVPELGRAFIAAAAQALRPGGRLWLVANRHLAYEQALSPAFASVRKVADDAGYKIIEAVKARA